MEALTRLGLVEDDEIILDEAALSLALLDHPDVDAEPYEALLDAVACRLEQVGEAAASPGGQADALRQVLADEQGFAGDRDSYDDPANADLIGVIDRRRGLPVSLSILWVAAARRVGWTADLLNLPGHVLVRIGRGATAVIVDPFRGGTAVEGVGDPSTAPRAPAAMTNRAVLVRLLLNQASRAEQAGHGRRALELYRRMTVLAPTHVHPWWERARLELVDGDEAAARDSLTALLEITREPELRERVALLLDRLAAA